MSAESARRHFRVLTRRRVGSGEAPVFDVQLQLADTGELVWAQTFSDESQAESYERTLESDLSELQDADFRRKYGVPNGA